MAVQRPRRYAVLGAGAIGSTYGSRLWRAGHPVMFALRSDRTAGLAQGLRVESPWGDMTLPQGCLCDGPAGFGPVDVLLVALKSTANGQLAELIRQMAAPPGWILLLQNGLGGEERMAASAPGALVVGGICEIACARIAPARVRHYAEGLVRLAPLGPTVEEEQACRSIAADLEAGGVPVQTGTPLRTIRWRKLVWNMAFNGLCTVTGKATQEVLADGELRTRLRALMEEVVVAARADGAELEDDLIADFLRRTEQMPSYRPSMLLDARAGRPLELEAIYRIPLERAARHGVAMAETNALLQELEALP